MASDPLAHIVRPRLPWRSEAEDVTECGRPASDVASCVSAEDHAATVARLGKTRAAMVTCMTCWSASERWSGMGRRGGGAATWDTDAAEIVQRWLARFDDREQVGAELRALARLVEAHRADFDELVSWEARRSGGARRRRRLG